MLDLFIAFIEGMFAFFEYAFNNWWVLVIIGVIVAFEIIREEREKREKLDREKRVVDTLEEISSKLNNNPDKDGYH